METAQKQHKKKFIVVFWRTKWSDFKAAVSKKSNSAANGK